MKGAPTKVRLPFPTVVTDRKQIKEVLVSQDIIKLSF
jgi:hypothetical protein